VTPLPDDPAELRRPPLPIRAVEAVGAWALGLVGRAGGFVEELGRAVRIGLWGLANVVVPPVRLRETARQMEFIGVQSLPIILLAASFTGAVFALQLHRALVLFGAGSMVGGTVGVAITRELGPTLTGLLVTGRAGSAMAAEIGTMRVTEQIDALDTMAVDPVSYLVKPRLLASVVMMPVLTAVFDYVGVVGAYVVGRYVAHLSEPEFMQRLRDWVDWDDIWTGLLKAVVFGAITGTVACYKGFYTHGGAAGVGRATTSSVVVGSVCILIANFFIAWALP
jgi:phospholipid/cholesterol/gamma-HCH transport system permease protein